MTWIAEQPVVFVWADGRREEGRIAVGMPEDTSPRGAACTAALDGLLPRAIPIHGGTRLHALVLAVRFLELLLEGFTSKGGRVLTLDPRGEVDAFAGIFGSLRLDLPGLPE